ncbi:MAG: hypothetical protein HQK83_17745 [Fibrobacteria bacterium]|nr:hypothetical protein [Fibrobacteria bacterium]
MKYFVFIIFLISFFISGFRPIQAQTEDEFRKQFQNEFTQYSDTQETKFTKYLEEQDKDFIVFLKMDWKKYPIEYTGVKYKKPKPANIPVAKTIPLSLQQTGTEETKISLPSLPLLQPPVSDSNYNSSSPHPIQQKSGQKHSLSFFNHKLTLNLEPSIKDIPHKKGTKEDITTFWKLAASANHRPLIEQLNNYHKHLLLGDWGLMLLAQHVAQICYPKDKNNRTLLTWFLLSKADLPCKLGYDNNQMVWLLFPVKQFVFQAAFFTFNKTKYYHISLDGNKTKPGALFSYSSTYPSSRNFIDLQITRWPRFQKNARGKLLEFSSGGKTHKIKIKINLNHIAFVKHFPQIQLSNYLKTPVMSQMGDSLLIQLALLIKDQVERDAINTLLHFTHQAFSYKTDKEQFGYEKFFFPEETLFYPFSDCEDRSILFSYLVRKLTGLPVIGIDYPGHIATAVLFSDTIPGRKVKFNGKNYTICDATYIGSVVGMEQKGMDKLPKKIISAE